MPDTANIHYHLAFDRFTQHLVDVTLEFTADQDAPLLWLPSWLPGSYLMREFARNITAVHYQVDDCNTGNQSQQNDDKMTKRANKTSKNEWQLSDIKAGQRVKVTYEVYCYDLSVRTAYVDQTRLFGNFSSLTLAIAGQEDKPAQVNLLVPQAFYEGQDNPNLVKLACGLADTHLYTDDSNGGRHQFSMTADSYHDLIDHPFEIAVQDEFDFIIHDQDHNAIAHRFFISGKHTANIGRLQQDLTCICQTYVSWLGDTPFSTSVNPQASNSYTFMTYASGNDYGGLEHINSTALITPRGDLPSFAESDEPSESYQRFLGLCSHEYFHSWWVKTVRPDVMMDVDLRAEAYTPLLWVFEGFTSYVDDFMLQASGVVSQASYLKLLAGQINRYTQTHGRSLQSVAESSFDAWIKLYRADENTGNAGISYYNKGALVALCLDLTLMQESDGKYRIFDVIKAFYEQAKAVVDKRIGMTDANLQTVICQFMSEEVWQDFKARFVDGVEELPIAELLKANGITVDGDDKDNTLPWGISVSEVNEGLKVNKVLRDSVAGEAGISAKDVIIAIDGIKASKQQLKTVAEGQSSQYNKTVTCHAFRRDELMAFAVGHATQSGISANPSLGRVELTLVDDGFKRWLNVKL